LATDTSAAQPSGVQLASIQGTAAAPHIVDILTALGPDATEVDLAQAIDKHLAAGNEVLLDEIKPFYKEPMRRRKTTTGADVGGASVLLNMAHGTNVGKQKLAEGIEEWAHRVTIERKK